MKRLSPLLLTVLLGACSFMSAGQQAASSSSSSSVQETVNVEYTGHLTKLGPSIALEGTHELQLDDGRTVLLESQLLNLDDYADMDVTVDGAVRPTQASGGIIMRVESVTILSSSSSSEMMSETGSEMMSESGTEMSSAMTSASSQMTSVPKSSTAATSKSSAVSSTASSAQGGTSAAIEAQVKVMAKEDMSASRWTQQYCTGHIGFCVPVYKNWWFTSFGTTGSSLWHVEVGNAQVVNLGDGPIVINLMNGDVSSTGHADGAVVTNGSFVTAFKAWKDNTHFEISAPVELKAAVTYMSNSLTSYQITQ